MKAKWHFAGFVLLIAMGVIPTLYWIFNGNAYCSGQCNRVIELLCEAKLTDLLLALFTYCLVVVGAYQGWYLWDTGNTMKLQTRAAVASQLPVLAWATYKLVEFNAQDQAIRDPVNTGRVPQICRPVFIFQNTGPTRILLLYHAMKWEITKELAKEPFFGGMTLDSRVIPPNEIHAITTSERINLTDEVRQSLEDGTALLWAYGFIYYNDFLDEAHHMGMVAKWDPLRGFVGVIRDNYSYTKSEKNYTK